MIKIIERWQVQPGYEWPNKYDVGSHGVPSNISYTKDQHNRMIWRYWLLTQLRHDSKIHKATLLLLGLCSVHRVVCQLCSEPVRKNTYSCSDNTSLLVSVWMMVSMKSSMSDSVDLRAIHMSTYTLRSWQHYLSRWDLLRRLNELYTLHRKEATHQGGGKGSTTSQPQSLPADSRNLGLNQRHVTGHSLTRDIWHCSGWSTWISRSFSCFGDEPIQLRLSFSCVARQKKGPEKRKANELTRKF